MGQNNSEQDWEPSYPQARDFEPSCRRCKRELGAQDPSENVHAYIQGIRPRPKTNTLTHAGCQFFTC